MEKIGFLMVSDDLDQAMFPLSPLGFANGRISCSYMSEFLSQSKPFAV